jgi:hypothetical protein
MRQSPILACFGGRYSRTGLLLVELHGVPFVQVIRAWPVTPTSVQFRSSNKILKMRTENWALLCLQDIRPKMTGSFKYDYYVSDTGRLRRGNNRIM